MSKKTGDDDQLCSDVKIVLLGKTGSGKSSTGNTILGREVFEEGVSPESVTVKCEQHSAERGGRRITIIDTPGIFGTSKTNEELKGEVEKSLTMGGPAPCVFLLVISLASRFTEEDQKVVRWVLENFGEDVSVFSIVLFTHADHLREETVEDYIKESVDLRRTVNSCGWRFHVLNRDRADRSQVKELFKKINALVDRNGKQVYSRGDYQKSQMNLREREKRRRQEEEERRGIFGQIRRVLENPRQFVEDKVFASFSEVGIGSVAAGVGGLLLTGTVGYALFLGAIAYFVRLYWRMKRQ